MKDFKKILIVIIILICSFNYSNVYSQGVINVNNKEYKADYYVANSEDAFFARFGIGINETVINSYSYIDDTLLFSLVKVPDMNIYFIYNNKHKCVGYFKMYTHEGSEYWGKFSKDDKLISVYSVGANYETNVTTGRLVDVHEIYPEGANITVQSSVTTFTEFTFGCFLLSMIMQESVYITMNGLN